MKRYLAILLITLFTINAISATITFSTFFVVPANLADWVSADHWVCKDNLTWYRYDKASKKLWKSTNEGKTWVESPDGMWNDANGNFLKIENGKVMETKNSKSPWKEVENWTWKGGDGNWYKFDKDWNLWEAK